MVDSNNSINNTVGASITGVTNTLTVTNPSDTASSVARTTITVGGASAGDPSLNFNVSGVTDFEMGIDNNASDVLKISQGTALGTNDTWIMTTAGERTMPLQPCFLALHAVNQANVTGDGTAAIVNYTTTIFDQNSDYDGTNTFTAPVTGKYSFFAAIDLRGLTVAHTNMSMSLVTSNRTLRIGLLASPTAMINPGTDVGLTGGGVVTDMDAADIARVQSFVGGSTKTVAYTNAATISYFSCFLAC